MHLVKAVEVVTMVIVWHSAHTFYCPLARAGNGPIPGVHLFCYIVRWTLLEEAQEVGYQSLDHSCHETIVVKPVANIFVTSSFISPLFMFILLLLRESGPENYAIPWHAAGEITVIVL